MLRVALITPSYDSNSFGRTHVLWRLSKLAGFDVKVVASGGGEIWEPLRNDEIVSDCVGVGATSGRRELQDIVEWADLVVAVKPVPASFGWVEPIARRAKKPIIVDIDDPDLPKASLIRLVVRLMLKPRKYWGDTRVRFAIGKYPHLVSNPVLRQWHGGEVIPHARSTLPAVPAHTSRAPVVAFVGTNHPHKGLEQVRSAVAAAQDIGVRLIATDEAPEDAKPWEEWIGRTTLEGGRKIVGQSDIVLLPSLPDPWSEGQLPAKLIDAMMAGRALVVSDLAPLVWAVGDGGVIVAPGNTEELTKSLRELADPGRRQELGKRARDRAESVFSEEAVAPIFAAACSRAADRSIRAKELT